MGKFSGDALARPFRTTAVGLTVAALLFSGASAALAQSAPPVDGDAESLIVDGSAGTQVDGDAATAQDGVDLAVAPDDEGTDAEQPGDSTDVAQSGVSSEAAAHSAQTDDAAQTEGAGQTDDAEQDGDAGQTDDAEQDGDAAQTDVIEADGAATDLRVTSEEANKPLAAPNGGAAPYVHWTVKDSTGTLRGGSSFVISGPYRPYFLETVFGGTWSDYQATIVDNGPGDLDPDAGEFLVKAFDGHSVTSGKRYRIRWAEPPTGYRFTQANDWVSIPGNGDTAPPGQWNGQIHDFGNFPVVQIPSMAPICTPGNIYSISGGGQMRRIDPNGNVTNVGSAPSNQSSMNGLGIGARGETVYAMQRTDNSTDATVWKFDTATGKWTSTGHTQSTNVTLVAGAVNLSTGDYVFGGFSSTGDQFHIWKYNPTTGAFNKVGYIATGMSSSSSNNGDMAFNAAGDAFIVLGRDTAVTVFSITAANFDDGNNNLITSSRSAEFGASKDVNGIAFDSAGKAYLGSGAIVDSFDMPDWSGKAQSTNALSNSTDLASCSSPATIQLQKSLPQGRDNSGDQFTLTLTQGAKPLGTATTTGSATGVQPQIVGPLPAARGAQVTFSETMTRAGSAGNYATSYECTVDGEPMHPAVIGTGTTGTVTIPQIGELIICEFVNTPLTASVTINKLVRKVGATTAEPAQGWTVNAAPTATTGSVTSTPNAAQQTDASGAATWALKFGTLTSRASVNVSESQKPGYEFESGQCVVIPVTGEPRLVTMTGEAATAVPNVAPGERVHCTYTNREIPGSIAWQKVSNDTPAQNIGGSEWTVQGPGPTGANVPVADCVAASVDGCATAADTDHRAGFLKLGNLAWGVYTVTETRAPDGFRLGSTTQWTVTVSAANAAGVTMDPVVNVRKLGSATWSKVSAESGEMLGGSVWSLTGPGHPAPGTVVDDCVADADSACTGWDKDADAGVLRIVDLGWGEYTLVETAAPLGYVLDSTPRTFTVSAASVDAVIELGTIENTLGAQPTLPLTGGLSSDFYKILGAGVLLIGGALLTVRVARSRKSREATR